MATKLDKLLKREIDIDGKPYMVTLSPDGVKLTEKGKRKGQTRFKSDVVPEVHVLLRLAAQRCSCSSAFAACPCFG